MASRSFGSTLFLSTPSARRATAEQLRQPMGGMISIHALREEGDTGKLYTFLAYEISIHALREEGDTRTRESAGSTKNFYPRPPRGGRRIYIELDGSPKFISIHALREEGDISDTENPIPPRYFYPRPPRGGRRMTTTGGYWQTSVVLSTPSARRATSSSLSGWMWKLFLSTPSARRATFCQLLFGALHPISIHALREEGDRRPSRRTTASGNFYPRPPRGGRPQRRRLMLTSSRFLSTPSARRATDWMAVHFSEIAISIHALREEGDH